MSSNYCLAIIFIHYKYGKYILLQDGTGWRRPTRCHKLRVIFRKRASNHRALLQKMTYKDEASCGSSPPCSFKYISLHDGSGVVSENLKDSIAFSYMFPCTPSSLHDRVLSTSLIVDGRVCTYIHIIHIYMYMCIRICIYMDVYMYIYTYTNVCIYIYIFVYICMYTCICTYISTYIYENK